MPCGECNQTFRGVPIRPSRHGLSALPTLMPPCPRCAGVGVLIDVRMPVLDRQIVDAWRAEPEWHRVARWRAEAAGRAGFFQPIP